MPTCIVEGEAPIEHIWQFFTDKLSDKAKENERGVIATFLLWREKEVEEIKKKHGLEEGSLSSDFWVQLNYFRNDLQVRFKELEGVSCDLETVILKKLIN